MNAKIIIAIDGPSGAGKSTAARRLAERLDYIYIDTGAMYRAIALKAERLEVDDEDGLKRICSDTEIKFSKGADGLRIWMDGEDVTEEIRKPPLSLKASKVSSFAVVRKAMVEMQRKIGEEKGIILEGRDIGTYVFPEAELKFYLDAHFEERAKRRFLELKKKGYEAEYQQLLHELKLRDEKDSTRELAPLKKASDAIYVDNTSLSEEEVIDRMEREARKIIDKVEIKVVPSSGFCYGVERSLASAMETLDKIQGPVYTFGPLIHNPQVVARLEEKGIRIIHKAQEIDKGTVIIRSHGITKDEMESLKAKGVDIIDATCPNVKKVHKYAQFLSQQGYITLIVGDKDHPEVEGIRSFVRERAFVVSSREDVVRLGLKKNAKIGIVCQTTQSMENFREIVSACLNAFKELRIFNTICDATARRQEESVQVAKNVDCMLVIGGYNSANTRRLAELCQKVQPRTYHIETTEDIKSHWVRDTKKIGITAGASTPHWLIEEVCKKFER